jgi:nitrite reductase/ring-hydroxylating ferredoxin subunit
VLKKSDNELLTRAGPETRLGTLLRLFWQPVALSEELPPDSPPRAVRVLNEDLVLFRDDQGRVGLLGLRCAHRGVELSYGRTEDGGLRCIYHGWLYDVGGRCLEQPGEPRGSKFRQKIRHLAYPCQELGGIVFAYLGPGDPPLLPRWEPLTAPPEHRFIKKLVGECNYLQGLEGAIDPQHVSFLHRKVAQSGDDRRYLISSVRGTNGPVRTTSREFAARDVAPKLEVRLTPFGFHAFNVRTTGATRVLRCNTFIVPNCVVVPGPYGADGCLLAWYVPIDDTHHVRWEIDFNRAAPIDREFNARLLAEEVGTDHRPFRTRANGFLQNREEMKTSTFAGLGDVIVIHDMVVTALEGPVYDRTQEHLGYTDKAIAAARRQLLKALAELQRGRVPKHRIDPKQAELDDLPVPLVISEIVPAGEDWKSYAERRRREAQAAGSDLVTSRAPEGSPI